MEQFAKETHPISLEQEMRRSYLDYAMSVIVGRALPDARDGLKPVHRRVLYAMHELSNDWNKAYKKSARIVGDVIGKYHPHGDNAVYDTIVRMAQDFSLRYPLVDGQGNFGSVDGDNAAAMRYTEIRMAKIAHELMADLDKETVDFGPNYDGSEDEPLILPAKFPNLLVNGSSGIAVGMATNIPPHNLGEVIGACLALLERPDTGIDELMPQMNNLEAPVKLKGRLLGDAAKTSLAGSSLGGLITAYAGIKKPDVFGRLGIFSPSTWWDGTFIIGAVKASVQKPSRVYIDSGNSGASGDDYRNTASLAQTYRDIGFRDGVSLNYVLEPGGVHNEDAWARRLPGALRFLLAGL
jgi:hypothetical protein